ncbi:MAG: hypothetical protein ACRECO_02075, partial [Xanthobacteraceae bacterium]
GAVEEVRTRHLREQLGEKVIAAAGLDFVAPIAEREARPQASSLPRHSEVRGAKRRASKGDGPGQKTGIGRASFEGRARARPPQDDGSKKQAANRSTKRKVRRSEAEWLGQPELARRERKHGRRPRRGKH